jgi:hypothetical protein
VSPEERDALGRVVRGAWVAWAREQPDPRPSWLVPYDELPERDKEADRRIGEAVADYVLLVLGGDRMGGDRMRSFAEIAARADEGCGQ